MVVTIGSIAEPPVNDSSSCFDVVVNTPVMCDCSVVLGDDDNEDEASAAVFCCVVNEDSGFAWELPFVSSLLD